MEIFFVTGNNGKFLTAQKELSEFNIQLVQKDIDIPEPRSYDIMEIAREKAIKAYEILKKPLIVHDAGFYLKKWKDFPGPFTNHALQGLGLEGLLKLIEGEDRSCKFKNVLAYIDGSLKEPIFFESNINGTASEQSRGSSHKRSWSKLHSIFIPETFNKTLAEMTDKEYDEYMSWRVQKEPIFRDFGLWLKDKNKAMSL
ncbi:MAG: non-canonical purine NTP pyrophosphatase [Nanoarchaeota archaeon]